MSGNPWNQTFSGLAFDLVEPDRSMVSIKDIAMSLANQCRFVGQCKRFYSVAEHCLYVSRVVPREFAFLALLHDAAESYVGDVSSPVKIVVPGFRELERRVWRVVAARFGLPEELPHVVDEADKRLQATEKEYLMLSPPRPWTLSAKPYELHELGLVHPNQFGLPPREAHRRFLERFAELSA